MFEQSAEITWTVVHSEGGPWCPISIYLMQTCVVKRKPEVDNSFIITGMFKNMSWTVAYILTSACFNHTADGFPFPKYIFLFVKTMKSIYHVV